jgi:mercuric reductase
MAMRLHRTKSSSSPARAVLPQLPGIDEIPYLTSTTALSLAQLPASPLVLGGGYIGAELAQMFARADVAVTLACRSRLLPSAEPEIGAALSRYFLDEGINVRGGLTYRSVRRTEKGVALEALHNGSPISIEVEQILIATGRQPNTEELGPGPAHATRDNMVVRPISRPANPS